MRQRRNWQDEQSVLEALEERCDDLLALRGSSPTKTQVMIALSQVFETVVVFLEFCGLTTDEQGNWSASHWGYRILEQLSDRVEACKASDGVIDDHFACFLADRLLPQLKAQSSHPRLTA